MFKHGKNSDEINPWTFRRRQTSRQFNEASPAAFKTIKSLREQEKINKKMLQIHSQTYKNTNYFLAETIHEQPSRVYCGKIPKHSIQSEALRQIQKTLPTCKLISFQYRFKPAKKKGRQKKIPLTSNSMRQFTEGSDPFPKRQEKKGGEYQKILKVRRYFTEEKDYEEYSEHMAIKKIDLAQLSKTQQLKRHSEQPIKIVKTCKNNAREEVITRGKLFEQVQNICQRKGISGGGHLSIMKRNYNIKKLEKLINQDYLK